MENENVVNDVPEIAMGQEVRFPLLSKRKKLWAGKTKDGLVTCYGISKDDDTLFSVDVPIEFIQPVGEPPLSAGPSLAYR